MQMHLSAGPGGPRRLLFLPVHLLGLEMVLQRRPLYHWKQSRPDLAWHVCAPFQTDSRTMESGRSELDTCRGGRFQGKPRHLCRAVLPSRRLLKTTCCMSCEVCAH
jgi:hypothetical protein